MKYIYVVDERKPYRSHVEEAESKQLTNRYTGEHILALMGDTAVLNAMYEILIRDGWLRPGDILAPERP
jgi:hypothetical protein